MKCTSFTSPVNCHHQRKVIKVSPSMNEPVQCLELSVASAKLFLLSGWVLPAKEV